MNAVLNWLYPPACMACRVLLPQNDPRQAAVWLCPDCEALFEPAQDAPDNVHTVYAYAGILRDIIRDIKFRRKKNHARALGRLWAYALEGGASVAGESPAAPALVPVPLHPNKLRERGFNQAEQMARELAHGLRLPMQNALARVVDTPPQAGLHPARRVENVAGAFSVARGCTVLQKSFILVDDIYTTGASLNECARTLLENGAASVGFMTLCATAKKRNLSIAESAH